MIKAIKKYITLNTIYGALGILMCLLIASLLVILFSAAVTSVSEPQPRISPPLRGGR